MVICPPPPLMKKILQNISAKKKAEIKARDRGAPFPTPPPPPPAGSRGLIRPLSPLGQFSTCHDAIANGDKNKGAHALTKEVNIVSQYTTTVPSTHDQHPGTRTHF